VIIVSLTGYFTVLDFGVNTAIVRYISKYQALNDEKSAVQVYSTSFALFSIIASLVVIATAIFALFFKDIFEVKSFSWSYLYVVFFIVGVDLALNLVFSVFLGTLRGLQRFFEINVISMSVAVLKNIILVYLLYKGHSLMTLAIVQACASGLKFLLQYFCIKKDYKFLKAKFTSVNKSTLRSLYNYSIYTFLIAIAAKVIFFTDSIVIGARINVSQVTYYAIPAMIMEYMEKFIWAIVGVLIPIISSQEAVGDESKNKQLYQVGTRYTLLLISPVFFVLYIVGGDFISLWMGENYGGPSGEVLTLLLTGYAFFLAQLVAHGILKGISKHKVLAYILCGEAVLNLVLSVVLAPVYGIKGVAMGTIIPFIIVNVMLLPLYTCKELSLKYFSYLWESIIKPLSLLVVSLAVIYPLDLRVNTYMELIGFSFVSLIVFGFFIVLFMLEKEHSEKIIGTARRLVKR
jgi:O-antigen/teichoic acid export membrane protein